MLTICQNNYYSAWYELSNIYCLNSDSWYNRVWEQKHQHMQHRGNIHPHIDIDKHTNTWK